MNILITGCAHNVNLVRALRGSIVNHGGGKILAIDDNPMSAALYFADDYLILPQKDENQYINELLNFCKTEKVDLIIPCSDNHLIVLSRSKSRFQEIGTKIFLSNHETLKICLNPLKFNKFCKEHQFPTPKTFFHQSEIQFPAFVKPANNTENQNKTYNNGFKVNKVSTQKQLELVEDIYQQDLIFQEYLSGSKLSIDIFSDLQGNVISIIPQERIQFPLNKSPNLNKGEVIHNSFVINQTLRLAKELNLIGFNTLQGFYNKDKENEIKFTRIKPRISRGAILELNNEIKFAEIIIRMLKDEKIESLLPQCNENLFILKYPQEIILHVQENDTSSKPKKLKVKDLKNTTPNQIYCIDVDGTVCTERVEYEKALPIVKVIKKINELYDQGHTIIMYTARGAYSGVDWSELTEKQLKKWGVKFHKLLIGKPFAHWYVDNKALHFLDWI